MRMVEWRLLDRKGDAEMAFSLANDVVRLLVTASASSA
jgi:hypothetical protein